MVEVEEVFGRQVVAGKELQDLLKEGHKPVPTQWIDTDKNERLKREGQHHEILHKSRLVARGDLEQSMRRSGRIHQQWKLKP